MAASRKSGGAGAPRARAVACCATLAIVALSGTANPARLTLIHPYGELIDRGPTTAYLEATFPSEIDCRFAPVVTKGAGNVFGIDVRLRGDPPAPGSRCMVQSQASLGELAAGWWTVTLRVLDESGSRVVEEVTSDWQVAPPDSLCNRHASLGRATLEVEHATLSGAQLAQRVATDPAYAATIGNPLEVRPYAFSSGARLQYEWLDNEVDLAALVTATGEFRRVQVPSPVCPSPPPTDRYGDVVEYVHVATGHYFYAVAADEIAGLDSGTGAKGWTRTGKSFRVLVAPGCVESRHDQGAYRFFGKPGVGPSSHVFTVDRRECRVVADSGAWLYESSPFWASPVNSRGGCVTGGVPLYRAWKPFGESNHRFTTDRGVIAEMVAKGWVDEGVRMCVSG
jgi:hypothetical protein